MDLLTEILIGIIKNSSVIPFSDGESVKQVLQDTASDALREIHSLLCNEELEDSQCVEEIVRVFEGLGCSCGARHDY